MTVSIKLFVLCFTCVASSMADSVQLFSQQHEANERERNGETPHQTPPEDNAVNIGAGDTVLDMICNNFKELCCGDQKWTIAMLMMSSFLASVGVSLLPPFYPKLAKEKSTSPLAYGVIMGSNPLSMFFATPCFVTYIKTRRVKWILAFGQIVNALCSFSFGCLDMVPSDSCTFNVVSCIIRIVQGVACSAVVVATFDIVDKEFNEQQVAVTASCTRIMFSLGYLLGPIVGGVLFHYGFLWPFLTLGSLQVIVCFINIFLKRTSTNYTSNTQFQSFPEISQIGTNFRFIPFSCFFVYSWTTSFLTLTLEPHIFSELTLESLIIGSLFACRTSSVIVTIFVVSCFTKKYPGCAKHLLCLSSLLAAISPIFLDLSSFSVINCFPVLPHNVSSATLFGLVLSGIGCGGQQVGSIAGTQEGVIQWGVGYTGEPYIQGHVAGIWWSLNSLSVFIFLCVGGVIVHNCGHSVVLRIICGLNGALFLFDVIRIPLLYIRNKIEARPPVHEEEQRHPTNGENNERQPLLTS